MKRCIYLNIGHSLRHRSAEIIPTTLKNWIGVKIHLIVLQFLVAIFRRFVKIVFCSEAATRGVLCKKVFLEISQNLQENTCGRVSFLLNLQASGLRTPFL